MTGQDLGLKELKMLAQAEAMMDAGEIPWVRDDHGNRLSVMPEVFEEFELTQGQTVTLPIIIGIQRLSIAHLETKIALDKAAKNDGAEGDQ